MKQISYKQLQNYLQDLFACNAFELHKNCLADGTCHISIPYMMNDALECYLLLKNCRMTGECQKDYKGDTWSDLSTTPIGPVLVFHQGFENVFTIWFESCYQVLTCYRYDQIGHFWVNGAEHWRRLVYIVGTIYDKYEYMGETVCNDKELALLPLMEFAPFRAYSPIHESLDGYYNETFDGLLTMETLTKEAKDLRFLCLIKLYRLFPHAIIRNFLVRKLNVPSRHRLYELIWHKIYEASASYPSRDYGTDFNNKITASRNEVTTLLAKHGFEGTYPLFSRGNTQIYAVEEHPFTVLDWDHFSFRIQFMISKSQAPCTNLHYGFFNQAGFSGRVESSLDFLEK